MVGLVRALEAQLLCKYIKFHQSLLRYLPCLLERSKTNAGVINAVE